jgi:nucleotide-binding universal stress UspA family protein
LFACNYPSLASDHKLSLLRELALTFDAQVRVLHVDQPEPAAAGKRGTSSSKKYPNLESILEGIKHHYEFLVEEDSSVGIQTGIEEYQADLLVMVPQRHGFWDIVMNQSVTRKLAFHTHIPLLTLPNPS